MVAIQAVRKSNACIAELPPGLVALFLGATSGIGQSTLIQFASHAVRPRIYIVARPSSAITAMLDELRKRNHEGTYTVIRKDVSLVRETSDVVEFVKSRETKLDLLFESVGFISLSGRQETVEGLDPSMTTRCYSRIWAVYGLLHLLNAAVSPRVVSILAGGQESKMNEEDLDLRKPGNYSVIAAAVHSATMLTLAFEHLARENPGISFVHAFPGAVATPLLSRGSTGLVRLLMTGVVHPLIKTFATSADEAGARALFYLANDRYSVKHNAILSADGLEKPMLSGGGIFLINEKSEIVDNEKVLVDYRVRGVDKDVWRHMIEIFNACTEKSTA